MEYWEMILAITSQHIIAQSNNKNTGERREICHCRRSSVFVANFGHFAHKFLLFLLLTLSKQMFAGNYYETLLRKSKKCTMQVKVLQVLT